MNMRVTWLDFITGVTEMTTAEGGFQGRCRKIGLREMVLVVTISMVVLIEYGVKRKGTYKE